MTVERLILEANLREVEKHVEAGRRYIVVQRERIWRLQRGGPG